MTQEVLAVPAELVRRRKTTEDMVALLEDQFGVVDLDDESFPHVAVIATGSLGRAELGSRSDLPLLGSQAYETSVQAAIDVYARDAGSGETFMAHFLINDLVRYSKTLCLKYAVLRSKLRIARLNLRFNRLWTCFNGLVFLVSGVEENRVTRAHLKTLVELSPVERAQAVAAGFPGTAEAWSQILSLYAEFLESTDHLKNLAKGNDSDHDAYRIMYDKSGEAGSCTRSKAC